MQRILLLISIGCSVFTAFALYAILSGIFRPFGVVAKASRKIADGLYSERIQIKGGNELASMAADFNRMAAEIERQIHLLEEDAAAKQQFVDNFAHEIRTPLTSIYGYAEYMQNAPLDKEEVIESAQAILKEAGYMRKIAESLLVLATLRQYTAIKQEIDLPHLFYDVKHSLRGLLPEKKTEIICECSEEILLGQEDLIRSLLMNLGYNALKACPDEGGVINIASRQEAGRTVLSVTDNGCGIPAESIDKVIEAFYRVDRARSRETGGAGLGLALCRQIAEAHGAELLIESRLKKGTKVDVIFTTL
jgi:signal transduction histidine kinase